MDQQTLNSFMASNSTGYSGLTLTGAWYTTCSGDVYGMYGQITLNDNGTLTSLTAGVPLDFSGNALL
jgi:hypothetical protein